jgi:hypothetical protein
MLVGEKVVERRTNNYGQDRSTLGQDAARNSGRKELTQHITEVFT